ncbi:MAG: class I SAM-dependent methyltransferase, partial [Pseudomonadota bacterium]
RRSGVPGTFVEGNVYDARSLITGDFDMVFVTWGAIYWLPDIAAWANVVASMLRTGGHLYLLEGHPAGLMLEQVDDRLEPTYPYFQGKAPLEFDEPDGYTGDDHVFQNTRTYSWVHPLSAIVTGLLDAGLRIDMFHEHDRLVWKLFPMMDRRGEFEHLPDDAPSLPLAFSLKAARA